MTVSTKVSPTQFELDMAANGKKIGDPIPKGITSRPDPGEYGGIYDEKPVVGQFVEAAAEPAVEQKASEAKSSGDHGAYKTRASRSSKDGE